jgi:hypothetical protein
MQTGVQIASSASSSPILKKGVVAVPEPLTSEILTQTVLQLKEGGLPVLNHQDAWQVTPEVMAAMERLMTIVDWVRSPAGGWPSDREVSPENLLPYVMDEALDVLECLEKSWMQLGLPASHPFAPLQKLLNDRIILSDAIAQLLWGVARSSIETMQLLGGMPADLFQAGKEWTPGILRLMAVLTVQTPNFQWQMDLVTAAPPLPELHPDSLVRWSATSVFWAEGLLQNLQTTIAQNTLPLHNLLNQAVPSEIIAPSQAWEKGSLHLSLGFTFAPHATKPVLTVLPATLAFAEPPKPDKDWDVSSFLSLPPNPQQGIASVSPLSTLGEGDDRPKVSPASLNGSAPERSPVLANVPVASEEAAEELFDENWVSGWGAPAPDLEEGSEELRDNTITSEALSTAFLAKPESEGIQDLFDGWGASDDENIPPQTPQEAQTTPDPPAPVAFAAKVPEPELEPEIQPDFEIVLEEDFRQAQPASGELPLSSRNLAEVVVDEAEHWNLDQWQIRWASQNTMLESDRLQLPRTYHVKTLLHCLGNQGQITQPSPHKEHHLVEIIGVACEALKLPDPPPTLLNTDFVATESSVAALVHRLTWALIRNSYGLTCLLSGINAEILQPEWGWEAGILRLLPILKIQGVNLQDVPETEVLDLQVDLGTGAPAPLETILVLPDILVNIDGVDWQKTRESAVEFRSGILKQIYQLLPELEVLCCPVPVEVALTPGEWQSATLDLQFELGFQTETRPT